MESIMNDILYCYKTRQIGHVGEEPEWIKEKETALCEFLGIDSMDRVTCDSYTDVITDLEDAAELYGFMLGIKLCFEILTSYSDSGSQKAQ